jgi:hypothetical protein
MTKPLACSLLAALLLPAIAVHASQPAWVDSKEYKVLIDPARFAGDPLVAAQALQHDLQQRVQQLGFDKPITGQFVADGDDRVSYYDVPGTCLFQQQGYTFRLRQGEDNSVQWKYRHADEELAAATNVSGGGVNPKTKLETDVSPGSLVYAHSTSQEATHAGEPHHVREVIAQFPSASLFGEQAAEALAPVGGLHIHQLEYSGPSSDLGKSNAKFTLSLWSVDRTAPALVELSFRVKADDEAYFTVPVLQRSQILMKAISSLDGWTLSPSTTKTAWLYNYRSTEYPQGFCWQTGRTGQ